MTGRDDLDGEADPADDEAGPGDGEIGIALGPYEL